MHYVLSSCENMPMLLAWSGILLYAMLRKGGSDFFMLVKAHILILKSKKLIAVFLKPYKDELAAGDITLKESTVLSMISKAKARGLDASAMREACQAAKSPIPSITDQINSVTSDIYENYEKMLRQTNSLDFDDLLLFGVKLFRNHRKAVEWCNHVLVDELYVHYLLS